MPLIIDSSDVTNSGLIETTGSAGLSFNLHNGATTTIDQSGGGTLLADGGDITFVGTVTVIGGTLEGENGGEFVSPSVLDGTGTLPVTIDPGTTVSMANSVGGTALTLAAGSNQTGLIDNEGTIALSASGSQVQTRLLIGTAAGGTVQLYGGGTVSLTDTDSGNNYSAISGPGTLENVDNTIEGCGRILSPVINDTQGVIEETGSVDSLTIMPVQITNSGLIEATGSAGLVLSGATIDQSGGGTLLADGGDIYFGNHNGTNSDIIGGTLTSENGSIFEVGATSVVTLDGTGTNGLTLSEGAEFLESGSVTTIDLAATGGQTASIVNEGTIAVDSAAALIIGSAGGDGKVELSGGGAISLSSGYIGPNVGSFTLENVHNTIEGSGVIGAGLAFVNDATGVIDANVTNATLAVETGQSFTNNGALEADSGTLDVTDPVAGTGSVLIEGSGEAEFASSFSQNATFDGVGTLSLAQADSGAIGGIGLDDTIALVGVTANGASVNGSNQLVVTENGTTVDTLQLSGNNSGFTFLTQAVSGGTDIVSLPTPATVADYLDFPSLYDQISGGFAISDTVANITANLASLNDSHINSITATSGTATLSGGAVVDAPAFALTGSSTVLTLAEILTYSGSFSEGAGSTVSISTGDTLTLKGTTSLSGKTSGAGTLAIAGGTTTVNAGASLTVSKWTISGSGTSLVLGENLTYAKTLSAGAGDTLDLSDRNLTLTGSATLAGTVIGGTFTLNNQKTVTEKGGTVTVGDASGDAAKVLNAATGTWDITDGSGIGRGSSTASSFTNNGLFEKTGGAGTSAVAVSFTDTGTVTAATGTLSFSGPTTSSPER